MKEVMKKLDFVVMQTSSIMGQFNCVNTVRFKSKTPFRFCKKGNFESLIENIDPV